MKRSEVNEIIEKGLAFLKRMKFYLPVWATWPAKKWAKIGHEADEIRQGQLGWDVTDFCSGDFNRFGLLLFTIRNGRLLKKPNPMVKDYCEKLLILRKKQMTPNHFHWFKMEDIINRGGGLFVMELWNSNRKTEALDTKSPVHVSIDGIMTTVQPGKRLELLPGQSITLPPFLYHRFWGEPDKDMVLAGEVSRVNDDAGDNRFAEPLPRFPAIEEDEAAKYLLCTEYPSAKK